jgi:hypothetical protein
MGGGNPSESESSRDDEEEEDEDKEEGEITSPPHSPPLEDLPSLGDLFSQQAGISIGAHRTKHPQTDTEGSSSPKHNLASRWYTLTCRELMFALAVARITHLLGVL